jgi:hypothetical protein
MSTPSWLRLAASSLWAAIVLAVVIGPGLAQAQPPEPHRYIDEYEGPATCETCHGDVTGDVIHTVHYSWVEKMDHYSPIPATIARINWLGMLNEDLGIPGGCARCHIGDGSMPKPPEEVTIQDRSGLDCLICHSPIYDTSLRFPVQNEDGDWTLTQDRSVLAAREAQRPGDENCLFCHLNVGGGPMLKRGVDFAPVSDKHSDSSQGDVHAEAGMVCVDCHAAEDHKVAGYGPTIWSRDLPDERLTCEGCHTTSPHRDSLINQHIRLDCRACHVPSTGGLVARDWTAEPEYDPVRELYSPVDDLRETNSVVPAYLWFNGQPARPEEEWPGDRWDETARIQPFKRYDGVVPVDARSEEPIPLKLGVFYTTGDLDRSVEIGAQDAGQDYSGSWEPKELTLHLQLSHGVVGKEGVLYCQDCHVADGRMDFAALGYTDEEVALFSDISASEAGVRQPLQMRVVIPEAQPLPTPVNLSGDIEAARGFGIRIPWSPALAVLAVVGMVVVGGVWLWRQQPVEPDTMVVTAEPATSEGESAAGQPQDPSGPDSS